MYSFEDLSHTSPNDFLGFCSRTMTTELCELASTETVGQSTLPIWFQLRFGRITASRLHEAAQCRKDGTLVQVIFVEEFMYDCFFY